MTGFLIYVVHAYGLAFFVPRARIHGRVLHGAQFFCGFCLIPLLLFLLHFVLGLDIRLAAYFVTGIAATGLVAVVIRWRRDPESRPPLVHPVHVLVLIVVAAGAVNGGVGYIPYLSDDVRTWIGVAKQIYALGRFDPPAMWLSNLDNPPGWPFSMVFPSLLLGRYEDGYAGLAPAVMHIGLLAFIYDVALALASRRAWLGERRAVLWAWALVAMMLLGEATGLLIPRNLMSEPPQVYGVSMIAVALLAIAVFDRHAKRLPLVIGIVCAAEYLIKIPIVAFVPALVFFAAWRALRNPEADTTGDFRMSWDGKRRFRNFLQTLAAMLGPAAVVYVCWKLLRVSLGGLSSPEIMIQWSSLPSQLIAPDSVAMLMQFAAAVLDYLIGYKVPATLIAFIGLVWGAWNLKTRPVVLALLVYVLSYLAALAIYHVTFYEELTSIQRFARVPVRALHLAGGFLWFIMALEVLERRRWITLRGQLVGRIGTVAVGFVVAGLFGWQVFMVDRMVVDLTSRRFQGLFHLDSTISREARVLRSLEELWRVNGPLRIVIINQKGSGDELEFAYHHLLRPVFRNGLSEFEIHLKHSWGQTRKSRWMMVTSFGDLEATFGKANVLWPLSLDGWMVDFLRARIDDPDCAERPLDHFLVPKLGKRLTFSCLPKS